MHSTLRRPPHREWSRELPGMSGGQVVRTLVLPVSVFQRRQRWSLQLRRLGRRWFASNPNRQVGVLFPD